MGRVNAPVMLTPKPRVDGALASDTPEAASTSPHKGKTGWTRIRNALFYSFDGFAAALRNEDAFRQEMLLALVLIPIAIQAPVSGPCKAMMVAAVLLVLVPMMTGAQGTDRALLQSDGSMNDR